MKKSTLGLLFFLCAMISVSGVIYNVVTLWNGIVIIPNFFPDKEDLHLGTLLIFLGLGLAGILFIASRFIKIQLNWNKDIQSAYDEQHSKTTLSKGWNEKPNRKKVGNK